MPSWLLWWTHTPSITLRYAVDPDPVRVGFKLSVDNRQLLDLSTMLNTLPTAADQRIGQVHGQLVAVQKLDTGFAVR